MAPKRLPIIHEIINAGSNKPRVYGKAWPIISDTGVGKLLSEGPRSPRSKRPQNAKYCSSGLPDRPYNSVKAARIDAIDCGSRVLPLAIIVDTCASTGSVGASLGMINVTVTPTKIIVRYCMIRGIKYRRTNLRIGVIPLWKPSTATAGEDNRSGGVER